MYGIFQKRFPSGSKVKLNNRNNENSFHPHAEEDYAKGGQDFG
jgi:hypothetical protein